MTHYGLELTPSADAVKLKKGELRPKTEEGEDGRFRAVPLPCVCSSLIEAKRSGVWAGEGRGPASPRASPADPFPCVAFQ